jgi:hypothetical protein
MTLTRKSPMQHKAALKSGEVKLRTRKPKLFVCKVCRCKFEKVRAIQPTCETFACKFAYADRVAQKSREKIAKAERQKTREQIMELKPLNYWAKRAERACNEYIRARDAGDPCISCGTYDAPEWHAGHCYTVAARADIRYNEDNIHLQCHQCNTYKGGMVGEYKKRIVSKIGEPRFKALEYVNPAYKKTREYYQSVEAEYKAKLKELKALT